MFLLILLSSTGCRNWRKLFSLQATVAKKLYKKTGSAVLVSKVTLFEYKLTDREASVHFYSIYRSYNNN